MRLSNRRSDSLKIFKHIFKLAALGLAAAAMAHPAAAKRAIDTQPGKAVLVGHSWGGTVITQAGDHPKVAALIYVAPRPPMSANPPVSLARDSRRRRVWPT